MVHIVSNGHRNGCLLGVDLSLGHGFFPLNGTGAPSFIGTGVAFVLKNLHVFDQALGGGRPLALRPSARGLGVRKCSKGGV